MPSFICVAFNSILFKKLLLNKLSFLIQEKLHLIFFPFQLCL